MYPCLHCVSGFKRAFLVLLLLHGQSSYCIHAQTVPRIFNYQARITGSEGEVLVSPAGGNEISIRIFDSVDGPGLVWGPQTFGGVQLVDGAFNILIGPSDSSSERRELVDVFRSGERYLEITVDGGPPIRPRQRMVSSPFALQAQSAFVADSAQSAAVASRADSAGIANDARRLNGHDWSAILEGGAGDPSVGRIDGTKIADRSVDGGKIRQGSITADLLADDVSDSLSPPEPDGPLTIITDEMGKASGQLFTRTEPGLLSGTVFLLRSDDENDSQEFRDLSENSHEIIPHGDVRHRTTVESPFASTKSSIFFDGDNDYLEIRSHADFDFGTSPFTIDFWVRRPSLTRDNFAFVLRPSTEHYFGLDLFGRELQINIDHETDNPNRRKVVFSEPDRW